MEIMARVLGKSTRAVGERLAELRRTRGLSQTELAERIGLTQRVMSHYEKGQTRIPGEVLLKIADVLKVSVYELLGRASSGRSPKDKKLWKAFEVLESLPPRDQKVVLRTLDAVAQTARKSG